VCHEQEGLDAGIITIYTLYIDSEFDADRSVSNKNKHGIDFVEVYEGS